MKSLPLVKPLIIHRNPKRTGEIAEAAFMLKARTLGFNTAKPWGDSERYDFILDARPRLWRVQLKCTKVLRARGYDVQPVYSIYGKGKVTYTAEDIDVLVVFWQNGKITNLGTLGGYESGAGMVNSRGQVTGFASNAIPDPYSYFGLGTQARAYLWDERNGMQDIGTLGGPDAIAPYQSAWADCRWFLYELHAESYNRRTHK